MKNIEETQFFRIFAFYSVLFLTFFNKALYTTKKSEKRSFREQNRMEQKKRIAKKNAQQPIQWKNVFSSTYNTYLYKYTKTQSTYT